LDLSGGIHIIPKGGGIGLLFQDRQFFSLDIEFKDAP
jgi:hypothetical protein